VKYFKSLPNLRVSGHKDTACIGLLQVKIAENSFPVLEQFVDITPFREISPGRFVTFLFTAIALPKYRRKMHPGW
jgi:hypothetical protein